MDDSQIADVGVVVVHGIGDQASGETLDAYGGAITDYAARRAHHVGIPFDRRGDDHRLRFSWQPDDRVRTCEITEGWWADIFDKPPVSSVLGWSALLAPWVVHRQIMSSQTNRSGPGPVASLLLLLIMATLGRRWVRRTITIAVVVVVVVLVVRRLLAEGFVGLVTPIIILVVGALLFVWFVNYMTFAVWVGIYFAKVVAFSLLILVLQAVLLLLALGTTLPIPLFRSWAEKSANILTLSVGDSYAFLEAEESEAEIVSAVSAAIDQQSRRCRCLVVVAHSQGCAVLDRVLEQHIPNNLTQVVTVGSGLTKLTHMRRLLQSRRRLIVGAAVRMVSLVSVSLLCFLAWRLDWTTTGESSSWVTRALNDGESAPTEDSVAFAIMIIFAMGVGFWGLWLMQSAWQTSRDVLARYQLGDQRFRWNDIVATHDLVPDGLAELDAHEGDADGVMNGNSFLFDHIRYHDNPEVLDLVMSTIETGAGSPKVLTYSDHDFGVLQAERAARGALRPVAFITFALIAALAVSLLAQVLLDWSSGWLFILGLSLAVPLADRPWKRWHRTASELERVGQTVSVTSGTALLNPARWIRLSAEELTSLLPDASLARSREQRVRSNALADEKRRTAEIKRERWRRWLKRPPRPRNNDVKGP